VHALADLLFAGRMARGLHAQAEGDVFEHRHVPEQRVVLEHEADPAVLRAACVASSPSKSTSGSGVRLSRPAMMRSSVVLPEPDGPSRATSSPAGKMDRHVVQR
jgi:hypothetical protein